MTATGRVGKGSLLCSELVCRAESFPETVRSRERRDMDSLYCGWTDRTSEALPIRGAAYETLSLRAGYWWPHSSQGSRQGQTAGPG